MTTSLEKARFQLEPATGLALVLVLAWVASCAAAKPPSPRSVAEGEPRVETRAEREAVPSAQEEAAKPTARPPAGEVPSVQAIEPDADREEPSPRPDERPKLPEPKPPAQYERILGIFTAEPDLFILLDPLLCEAWCNPKDSDLVELGELASQFRALGLQRAEATAHLNSGALHWRRGQPEQAYREILRAQALFSVLADIEGLAHAFEWLGFLFKESRALDRAAEHLGAAHKFYVFLGSQKDVDRVLSYGE